MGGGGGCGASTFCGGLEGCTGRRFGSSSSSCPISIWLVFIVSAVMSVGNLAGSVPTTDFRVGGGEKEVATLTSRSLYWSPFPSTAAINHNKRSREVQPIQLCGYRLLEAVRGLCRGNYVGYTRRSDPDMADEHRVAFQSMREVPPSTEEMEDTGRYQLLSNGNDQGLSTSSKQESRHFRFRRNIIDECCKKPCSVNEMLRYCGRT